MQKQFSNTGKQVSAELWRETNEMASMTAQPSCPEEMSRLQHRSGNLKRAPLNWGSRDQSSRRLGQNQGAEHQKGGIHTEKELEKFTRAGSTPIRPRVKVHEARQIPARKRTVPRGFVSLRFPGLTQGGNSSSAHPPAWRPHSIQYMGRLARSPGKSPTAVGLS